MVRRQRHSRRMDERYSWPKCCEAEAQQARSIFEGPTVRMPFAWATASQRICHLMASGCWLRRSVIGRTGSSCRPGRDRQEPYRPDPSSSGSRRTFSRMDAGLCSEGVRKITVHAFIVQDVESGLVRAISPENTGTVGVATPDGRFVIGAAAAKRFLYPVDGGAPVPLPIMAADDIALQWSSDGRLLYVRRGAHGRRSWTVSISRLAVARRGRRFNLRIPSAWTAFSGSSSHPTGRPTATITSASSRNCSSSRA